MLDPITLTVVGAIAAVGGLIALGARLERKRTAAFKDFASQRRYTFGGATSDWERATSDLRLFQHGRSKRFFNFMHGAQDASTLMVSDYEYVSGTGKNRTTHQFTVCVVRTPGLRLASFYLRPQRAIYDRLGKLFGGKDLNFDDDPEFSKAYVLQGDANEDATRRLFTPGVREHLRQWSEQEIWMEGSGEVVLVHHSKRIDPSELERLLTDAVTLRRLFVYDLQRKAL